MMYPRLKLLQKLLAKDGVIFISIDDNEYQSLKFIMDEIFGGRNHLTTFTWRTDGNFDNQAKIKVNHEYITAFSKEASTFEMPKVVDPNVGLGSKLFNSEIINTIVKNGPKNPISEVLIPEGFPANFDSDVIQARTGVWPEIDRQVLVRDFKVQNEFLAKSGWSSKNILLEFIKNGLKPVLDTKGQATDFHFTSNGAIENVKRREAPSHVVSSLYNLGSTQNMSSELKEMGFNFDYPKPVSLIGYFLKVISKRESIILDSFAGSGTTAHAVLNLNKADGGNRKFILIEMEDYASTITAERVKRVIDGYGEEKKAVLGTGGNFAYFELGAALFDGENNLNEAVSLSDIRNYIWYSETRTPFQEPETKDSAYFLGSMEDTAYYFVYERESLTTLDFELLSSHITTPASQYIIYADNCLLPAHLMEKHRIIFKKIPRDITRF